MNAPIRSIVLAISLMSVFGSCTVQDHLQPAAGPSPYDNVLLTGEGDLRIDEVGPNSTLKVGDWHPEMRYGKIAEIIELGGKKYALAQAGDGEIDYDYDDQGRVTLNRSKSAFTKGATRYEYAYAPGKIIQTYENEGLTARFTTTIDLNKYGFIPDTNVTYNQDGYVIERRFKYAAYQDGYVRAKDGYTKYTILDGNVVKTETKDGIGEYITTYEFDLTKPNVPNAVPFLGKKNRNLVLKATVNYVKLEPEASNNKLLSSEYHYVFDQAGKVTLQLTLSTVENWPVRIVGRVFKYRDR